MTAAGAGSAPGVRLQRHLPHPIETVWQAVSDVRRHRVPLTRVRPGPGEPQVGWRFVAQTRLAVGRVGVGLQDSMVVTRWQPPAADRDEAGYALVKTGRVVGGWAEIGLRRTAPDRTLVTWRESITVHPQLVGRLLQPATDRATRALLRAVLNELFGRA